MLAEEITFSAGDSKLNMRGDKKVIELHSGAKISTQDVDIEAQDVRISGDNYSLIECEKNVKILDYKHKISIFSTSLHYNRNTENIIIDGWVEMQDLTNEVTVSAAWMDFDMNEGILKMQIRAKIIKKTDKGPMICSADNIVYDRDNNTLLLSGDSSVSWDGNEYSASNIQVNLKTEEINMVGDIKGEIKG